MKPVFCLYFIFLIAGSNASGQNKQIIMDKINIKARPLPVQIDIQHTAILVVDMQNDFGSKKGMFDLAGVNISMIKKAVAPIATVLSSARAANMKIIYLKMGFQPDLSDLGSDVAPNRIGHLRMGVGNAITAPDGSKGRILIRDTWNTDIIDELKPEKNDVIIYKHRFSGFFETNLDSTLKSLGIKTLIVTGCTTSICVESTVRDAMFRDYSCIILEDCTAEPLGSDFPRSNHDASIFLMQTMFGSVSDSKEFIKSFKTKPVALQ